MLKGLGLGAYGLGLEGPGLDQGLEGRGLGHSIKTLASTISLTEAQIIVALSGSTRWRWSHSKSSTLQRQPISAVTYSPATVCGIYGRRTLLCCVNLSPKLTSPDVVSVTQLLPSGTHFLEQYSKASQ